MITGTAVVWNIEATDEEVVRESTSWDPNPSLVGELETPYSPDLRTRVEKRHYAPGGKYRSVLKIHVKYNKNDKSWTTGTGWLLRNDLVVTAGHVVLAWPRNNRAVYLNTYAGYEGLVSVGQGNVQKRQANRVLVLKAYQDNHSSTHDVAIVKLREPFENIQPFTFCETPEEATNFLIGVVGYPVDKNREDVSDLGPFMYEEFASTSWNLHDHSSHLLQYQISTFDGQSGAPVILDVTKFQCIGTHIQGFCKQQPPFNYASPIGGLYGNPYDALLEAIEFEPLQKSSGAWEVPLSRRGPPEKENRKGQQQTSKSSGQPGSSSPDPSTQLRGKEDAYATLQQYDTLFLVDDSASMTKNYSVTGNKWEITKKVMAEIADIVVKHNSDGVDVQCFNYFPKPPKGKNLRSAEDVMSLCEDVKPYGPSPIADKLDEVLNEYCYKFDQNRRIRGLNLIVLTAKKPDDDQDVEAVIVKWARIFEEKRMHLLKVGIQFVQIGNNPEAAAYFKPLDDTLKARHKLDRDMVDTVLWVEGGSEPLHQKVLLGGILRQYDNDVNPPTTPTAPIRRSFTIP